MKTEQILAERGNRYGSYAKNAESMQRLKDVMRAGSSWDNAPDIVKEALDCIALKIGRIINGDSMYADSWQDLIGYSQLVLDEIYASMMPASVRSLGPDTRVVSSVESRCSEDTVVMVIASDQFGKPINLDLVPQLRGHKPEDVYRALIRHHGKPLDTLPLIPFAEPTVDPTAPGPDGTEPQDVSHAIESFVEAVGFQGKPAPEPPVVPRTGGVHLTDDHIGMHFRRADNFAGMLRKNDGPEPERFPFVLASRRYTEYGFCAAADGDPIHDIVGHHPH